MLAISYECYNRQFHIIILLFYFFYIYKIKLRMTLYFQRWHIFILIHLQEVYMDVVLSDTLLGLFGRVVFYLLSLLFLF
jgi:hypothetical protein